MIDCNAEGYRLVRASWQRFWDGKATSYKIHDKSGGAYDGDGHITVWPIAVNVQALIDAYRIFPKEVEPMMNMGLDSFHHYYNPQYKAYSASFSFPGNKDLYYDDNAQVASCFLSAYEVTQNRKWLDKAVEVVEFLMTGLYSPSSKYGGGVRWHVSKEGANSISTSESGLAAMRLARFVQNNERYIEFGKKCAQFIFTKVRCNDKLIGDGLEDDPNGGLKPNESKWTYNQGVPISLCCALYLATRDEQYYNWAAELAHVVTDHNTAIFDRDTRNMDARYYRDQTCFYQLLAEGLADFMLHFGAKAPESLKRQIIHEMGRTGQYVATYLRNPADGLYFQTFELFRLDREHYEQFKQLTGENKDYQPSGSERESAKDKVPIEDRKMITSFMGCGAAARIFFQTARVVPQL